MDTALINFHLIHLPVKRSCKNRRYHGSSPGKGRAGDFTGHRGDTGLCKNIDGLPAENVLKFILKDHSWITVRPSGTETQDKGLLFVEGER